MTTWHYGANAGYGHYRTEGYLLRPGNATCSGAPTHIDETSWLARGNYINDSWPQPNDFGSGDRTMFTAPQESYTVDYRGTQKPVRGNFGTGVTPGELQTRFNDPAHGDNSGGANAKLRHGRP